MALDLCALCRMSFQPHGILCIVLVQSSIGLSGSGNGASHSQKREMNQIREGGFDASWGGARCAQSGLSGLILFILTHDISKITSYDILIISELTRVTISELSEL